MTDKDEGSSRKYTFARRGNLADKIRYCALEYCPVAGKDRFDFIAVIQYSCIGVISGKQVAQPHDALIRRRPRPFGHQVKTVDSNDVDDLALGLLCWVVQTKEASVGACWRTHFDMETHLDFM